MKKMRVMKQLGMMATTCALALTLNACGKSFDASAYTQAVLDANVKGDFDTYEKATGESKDEVEESYNSKLDSFTDQFVSSIGFELSEEVEDEYKDFFARFLQKANYSVGEAVADGDGYTVDVTVTDLSFSDDVQTEIASAGTEFLKESQDSEGTAEDMYDGLGRAALEVLDENLDKLEMGDETTYTVHFTKNEDGTYAASEDDMEQITNGIIGEIE